MKDFRKEILDQARDPSPQPGQGEMSGTRGFPVGSYEAEEIPFEAKKAGLSITATEPTEGFRRQLIDDELRPLSKNFRVFIEWSAIKDELATGSWYNRMVWQVASLAPISYMLNSTVSDSDGGMIAIANTLKNFDFSVIMDGVRLFRPILLDGPTSEVSAGEVGKGEGPFHFPLRT